MFNSSHNCLPAIVVCFTTYMCIIILILIGRYENMEEGCPFEKMSVNECCQCLLDAIDL